MDNRWRQIHGLDVVPHPIPPPGSWDPPWSLLPGSGDQNRCNYDSPRHHRPEGRAIGLTAFSYWVAKVPPGHLAPPHGGWLQDSMATSSTPRPRRQQGLQSLAREEETGGHVAVLWWLHQTGLVTVVGGRWEGGGIGFESCCPRPSKCLLADRSINGLNGF